ncbi:hypothetical protein NP493_65g02022 [Ridgeia piscesae]|uniref:Uncharacterized protein n=1 Tax=Ridgeia piscesae TaxID=27915 RepID=A0AAD9PAA8_RIDPI|nr:hypothetical protein NP493_65g02022 [Ridgeia piscesae]
MRARQDYVYLQWPDAIHTMLYNNAVLLIRQGYCTTFHTWHCTTTACHVACHQDRCTTTFYTRRCTTTASYSHHMTYIQQHLAVHTTRLLYNVFWCSHHQAFTEFLGKHRS